MLNPYTKAILAAALAVLAALASGFDDSHLTTTEIVVAVVAGLSALAIVWASHPMLKWLWSGLIAGGTALGVALSDDSISAQEWITIITATVVALFAIYQTANTVASNAPSPAPE